MKRICKWCKLERVLDNHKTTISTVLFRHDLFEFKPSRADSIMALRSLPLIIRCHGEYYKQQDAQLATSTILKGLKNNKRGFVVNLEIADEVLNVLFRCSVKPFILYCNISHLEALNLSFLPSTIPYDAGQW